MEKREKVLLISIIILVGFVVAVIYHYVFAFYLGKTEPYNTFLAHPRDFLCDFYRLLPDIKGFAPYLKGKFGQNYFPLAYLMLSPFAYIKNVFVAYFIFASIFIAGIAYFNTKAISCEKLTKLSNFQNIFIMTVLPYPLLYLMDRGNFDMIMVLFFVGFLFAFQKEKYKLAAILLAITNAMKPFAVLFLFLFLIRKKYKEFFLSIGITFIFIFGGFMFFKGDFFAQVAGLFKGTRWYKSEYVYSLYKNNYGMERGSSLFMLLKLIFCKSTPVPIISTFLLDKIYSVFCFVAAGLTLFFTWREKVFWKQVALLTCNMMLLPYYMEDYKLIFLFAPIWLFIMAKEKSRLDVIYAILLALLFIPKHIIIFRTWITYTMSPWFSTSVVINPLIIITLMVLIVYDQFRKKEKDNEEI